MVVDRNRIKDWIKESIEVKETIRQDPRIRKQIETAAAIIFNTIRNGGKILSCGNGGSASDSAHFVGELLNRFTLKREYPIAAVDLSAPNSTITAIANDYSFGEIFAKQIRALGRKEDILLAISTSGKSFNIKRAVEEANNAGMLTVFLTGQDVDIKMTRTQHINVPSNNTPIIQESHIMIIHILCHLIDEYLEGK